MAGVCLSGCSLDKESVFHILNCLKNNECMNTTARMNIGINVSLRTDPEIMELLEIDLVSSYINLYNSSQNIPVEKKIVSKGGGTWTVTFNFNTPPSDININLSKLINGDGLFYRYNEPLYLTSFTGDLSSLEEGTHMFDNCAYLKSFNANLDKLKNARAMFGASTCNLSSFRGSLKSLRAGKQMFEGCRLDKESVINIITTLQTQNTLEDSSYLDLGVDYKLQSDAELMTLLKLDSSNYCQIKSSKGGIWNVGISWN